MAPDFFFKKKALARSVKVSQEGICGRDASELTTVFKSCWVLLLLLLMAPTSNGLSFRGLTVGLAPSRTWQRSLRQSRAASLAQQWHFFPGKCDRNGNAISSNVMHKLLRGALTTMTCVSRMLMDFTETSKVDFFLTSSAS